jgi:plasmid stability protein
LHFAGNFASKMQARRLDMATLTVRDIDDADYENLQLVARKNNRSTAAHVREMIADANRQNGRAEDAIARLKAFQEKSRWTLPKGIRSLDVLREERDSW